MDDEVRRRAAELALGLVQVVYVTQVHPEIRAEYVSDGVVDVLGYTPQEYYDDPLLGFKVIDPRDAATASQVFADADDEPMEAMVRRIHKDGRVVLTVDRLQRVHRDDGSVVLVGVSRLEPDQGQFTGLAEAEELHRLIAENSLDVVYMADLEHRVTWVSPSVTEVLGWTPSEFVGRPVRELAHPDDLVIVRQVQAEVMRTGADRGESELRFATRGGGWRWMRVTGRPVRDADGVVVGGIDVLRDIQREVETRQQLQHQSDHDPLTGLANRTRTVARIEQVVAQHPPGSVYVLLVGVDDLKAVNESLTYTAGDRMLSEISERIVRAHGVPGDVGRAAGNEIAVIVSGSESPEDVAAHAGRILDAARGPVAIGDHVLGSSVSIGIAPANGSSAETMLGDASLALHQAKQRGGGRWEFLDPATSEAARQRIVVQSRLREALAAGEIHAWFQPIVALPGGAVRGYEALVRWVREDGSLAEPDSFIPTAERTDLIVAIDRAVLSDAVALLARLKDRRHVAVNVSAASLATPDLAEHVLEILAEAHVAPSRLHLEITETSLVHVTDDVRAAMRTLAAQGISWYVDDFGTGYSSITHLRDLPVVGLKLDRSFTSELGQGGVTGDRIAGALAGLARGLGLDTVAEGIETRSAAEALAAHGWAHGQGWLFGRPMPPDLVR